MKKLTATVIPAVSHSGGKCVAFDVPTGAGPVPYRGNAPNLSGAIDKIMELHRANPDNIRSIDLTINLKA